MEITYTKKYGKREFDHFTSYSDLDFKDTYIFFEYYDLISRNKNKNKEQLLKLIEDYKPKAKSKLRWSLEDSVLSFYPPNKYIFPRFYLIFK